MAGTVPCNHHPFGLTVLIFLAVGEFEALA